MRKAVALAAAVAALTFAAGRLAADGWTVDVITVATLALVVIAVMVGRAVARAHPRTLESVKPAAKQGTPVRHATPQAFDL